ncbi:MAG TPA: hypothetical protein VFD31_11230 [Thermoleophilaceae bacterium]|nr:hypothetical protein [Thermoleophilaceae bacterium]
MDPTRWLAVFAIVGVLGVVYGGWALLTFVTGREGLSEGQKRFFRAGHAHAGVLLVLSLAFFLYLERAGFPRGLEWTVGLVLLLGVMAQSGGFFVHMSTGGSVAEGSAGTRLTRGGAVLIGASLLALAVGLATA